MEILLERDLDKFVINNISELILLSENQDKFNQVMEELETVKWRTNWPSHGFEKECTYLSIMECELSCFDHDPDGFFIPLPRDTERLERKYAHINLMRDKLWFLYGHPNETKEKLDELWPF